MPVNQFPFSYDDWAKLTLSGGARQHSFPAMGAEGSEYVTPLPKTGGGGGGEPEEWVHKNAFKFTLDNAFVTAEGALGAATTPIEITVLDHFPTKDKMIQLLTPFATPTDPNDIFQLLIDGLNAPSTSSFQITVEDKHPLLSHVLTMPVSTPDSFEGTLQAYNNDPEVREEIGHGLFITGIIIHLLKAQGDLTNVKIRLISVLNEKQLGLISDIAGVIKELKAIHRSDPDLQRLVNCSIQVFTPFDPPLGLDSEEMRKFIVGLLGFLRSAVTNIGTIDVFGTMTDLLRGRLSLIEIGAEILMGVSNIFEVGELLQLTTFLEKMDNFEIIAAAGNIPSSVAVDATAHPLPTYPAHIHTVLGVGSMVKAASGDPPSLATFSRKSQVRPASTDGITTLGEVVGPYIGNIASVPLRNPDGTFKIDSSTGKPMRPDSADIAANFEGFVKWEGTSFSTAIITGLMGRLVRRGQTAETAFKTLRGIADQNDDDTNVLPIFVTQP